MLYFPGHPKLRAGLSFEQLLAVDAELSEWRLMSLAAYGLPSSPRFAAIWWPTPARKRKIVESHGFGSALAAPNPHVESPILVTGTADARLMPELGYAKPELDVFLATVYELYGPEPLPKASVEWDEDAAALATKKSARMALAFDVVVHPVSVRGGFKLGSTFIAVLREPRESRDAFQTVGGVPPLSPSGVRESAFVKASRWASVQKAVPMPRNVENKREVWVHFRGETRNPWPNDILGPFDTGTWVDGPVSFSNLNASFQARLDAGQWPLEVGANGTGQDARFCVTYVRARDLEPLPKAFYVQRQANIELPSPHPTRRPAELYDVTTQNQLDNLDNAIQTYMEQRCVHGVQWAVAKNGRLKWAPTYTWAEGSWPKARPKDKFRWASVSKFLVGIHAAQVAESEPAWLSSSIASLYGLAAPHANASQEVKDRFSWLQATTPTDLLRMQGCLQDDDNPYAYWKNVFLRGGKHVPVRAGDFSEFVLASTDLDYVGWPPNTQYKYVNQNFQIAGELLSKLALDNYSSYAPLAQAWFGFENGNALVIGVTPEKCLQQGEVVCRGYPGVGYNALVPLKTLRNAGHDAPLVPYEYSGIRDYAASPSGYWVMSAAAMVRLLQALHPREMECPLSPSVRLPLDKVQLLMTTAPIEGVDPPYWGLGCGSQVIESSPARTVVKLWKDGDIPGGTSRVQHYFTATPHGGVSSLSIAIASTTISGGALPNVFATCRTIDAQGGWDNDVDLFPDFL